MSSPHPKHEPRGPRGWHGRGYLPHFDAGEEYAQFVTFRLADSVPHEVMSCWQLELRDRPESERGDELHRFIGKYLDSGYGACHLRDPRVAGLVEGALRFFDADRYDLYAWVVMPNHVHVVFTPAKGISLSFILGSWKSFTSKEANKILGRTGQFWQEDYFDRFVRNEHHFNRVVEYAENNPVSAGLCPNPDDWRHGSAAKRECHREAAGTAALRGENS